MSDLPPDHSRPDDLPPSLPPSLPPFVKYVLAPAAVGLLWFALGPVGALLAIVVWLGWYVYEGYAEPRRS